MKKLLLALFTLTVNSHPISVIASPNLIPMTSFKSISVQENKCFLPVPPVPQVTDDTCAAASLMSIFRYWGWEVDKTQQEIYQEMREITETPNSTTGVIFNDNLGAYINDFIETKTGNEVYYQFKETDFTFGVSVEDVNLFSAYVWNSLSNEVPILCGLNPANGIGHTAVLCGYAENIDNPWYDTFAFMDPADDDYYEVMAIDLHKIFRFGIQVYGFEELGAAEDVKLEITPFTKELKSLPGNGQTHFAEEIRLNITKRTGISDFAYFATAFEEISLPDIKTEIKKVNDDPNVRYSFKFPVNILPKEDIADNWKSNKLPIHSFSEAIGCEIIKTWVSFEAVVERAQNNELILSLRFYGGAKVTKDKMFVDESSLYELTGGVKISSGTKVALTRKPLFG